MKSELGARPNSVIEVGPGLNNIFSDFYPHSLSINPAINRIAIYPQGDMTVQGDFPINRVRIIHHDVYRGLNRMRKGSSILVLMQNVVNDPTFLVKDFYAMENWCSHTLCSNGLLMLVDTIQRQQSLYDKVGNALLSKNRFNLLLERRIDTKEKVPCIFDCLAKHMDKKKCLDDNLVSNIYISTLAAIKEDAIICIYERTQM